MARIGAPMGRLFDRYRNAMTMLRGAVRAGADIARQQRTTLNALAQQPPPDYGAAYRQSLENARSGIQRQFALALGDIAQRESAAGQAVGTLPGQLQSIYAQGGSGLANAAAALDAAQKASGVTSFMGANAQLAPLRAAIGQDLAARQADVPLLRLAMQTEFARQRAGLQNARIGAEQDLAAEARQYALEQARRQQERQYQLADLADQRRYEERQTNRDFLRQLALRNFDLAAQRRSERDPDTGLTVAEMESVRQSAPYRYAVQLMREGEYRADGKRKQVSAEGIYSRYRTNPRLLKVLAADFPEIAAFVTAKLGGV
jgi:hypothetical protein